jgi:diaminohydroxyphosphoribosylaminopyrimidine deaminase/5-amino-6-(5-phosphoribosylamino)uracil reductase
MRAALALAARGLGNVWPNPAVGCLIVRDGRVVGRGWTQPGGRPHAEARALEQAGAAARGACAYVTLEPCSHHGETPPCADALIDAGIARVVFACGDPDPKVDGRGAARLREAGVQVVTGVAEDAARALNAGFILHRTQGRPLVTLKLATTLDGRIATAGGDSQWITGPLARRRGHLLRADHDAIMIGSGTALADDPMLTCRLPGGALRQPVRVVMDARLRLPAGSRLATSAARAPVWVLTAADPAGAAARALSERGCELVAVPALAGQGVDGAAALAALAERGITRLLVEGGGRLAASLLAAGLVDRLAWFRAPAVMGGDGLPGVDSLGLEAVAQLRRFRRTGVLALADDLLESYVRPA